MGRLNHVTEKQDLLSSLLFSQLGKKPAWVLTDKVSIIVNQAQNLFASGRHARGFWRVSICAIGDGQQDLDEFPPTTCENDRGGKGSVLVGLLACHHTLSDRSNLGFCAIIFSKAELTEST